VTMVLEIVDAQLGTAANPLPPPERTSNGGAPPSLPPTVGKPVLSSRDIQQEKEWVLDQERWVYSRADIAAGKLDEALRARLRKKVPLELVEIEFKRVMGVIAAK
jgi:hypothetical protein